MPGPAWIVLPTYREADNVEPMVRALRAVVPAAHVLVVDDASPDGTGLLADRLAAADPQVEVLHRDARRGIGPAYRAGFDHALAARRRRAGASSTATSPTTPRPSRGCWRRSTPAPTWRSARATSPAGAWRTGRRGGAPSRARPARTRAPCCACRSATSRAGCKAFRADGAGDDRVPQRALARLRVPGRAHRARAAGGAARRRAADHVPRAARGRVEAELDGRARGRLADPGAAATGAARGLPILGR